MPEFKVDLMLAVTAYVEADSEEEALEIFDSEFGTIKKGKRKPCKGVYIGPENKHVYVTDEIKLSPVTTSYGFNPDQVENLDA